jgi:hypothetical protein
MSIFTTDDYPRFTLSPAGLPLGVYAISATMTSPEGKVVHRSVTIDFPSVRSVAVDFPPLPPGIHQMKASVDGRDAGSTLAVLVFPPGWTLEPGPVPEGSAERQPESVPLSLQRHLLDPRRPVVVDRRYFDPNGNPTLEYFALRIADHVVAEAEPIGDPGLFPADVRVASFRKGASVLFAMWSEGSERELALPFQEATLLTVRSVAPRALRGGDKFRVGSIPLFLLDVDPGMTELSVDLSASELPLQLSPTRLTMRIRNRSQRNVPQDLQISLDGLPAGWRASTRFFRTSALQPGAVYEEAFDLTVPPSESERAVDLRFDLGFTIRGKEMSLRAQRQITLKSTIRIEASLRSDPSRMLSVRIVNGSDHAMTISIRSRIPGLAERLDLIRDLAPGSSSRAFEFPAPDTGSAEILVQEAGGNRAVCRRLLPLR